MTKTQLNLIETLIYISTNLPTFYHECRSLIGYATIYSVVGSEKPTSVPLLI